tara:strand:- start:2303 stop:2530 length:228 start_codon:yes stop_codon:yes gene_type:complete
MSNGMTDSTKGILSAVIVLVIFLALLPTIVGSVVTAAATTGLSTSAASIINLIPLVVAAGGIGLAGWLAYDKMKG